MTQILLYEAEEQERYEAEQRKANQDKEEHDFQEEHVIRTTAPKDKEDTKSFKIKKKTIVRVPPKSQQDQNNSQTDTSRLQSQSP